MLQGMSQGASALLAMQGKDMWQCVVVACICSMGQDIMQDAEGFVTSQIGLTCYAGQRRVAVCLVPQAKSTNAAALCYLGAQKPLLPV